MAAILDFSKIFLSSFSGKEIVCQVLFLSAAD